VASLAEQDLFEAVDFINFIVSLGLPTFKEMRQTLHNFVFTILSNCARCHKPMAFFLVLNL
jgi:hypothetical protein